MARHRQRSPNHTCRSHRIGRGSRNRTYMRRAQRCNGRRLHRRGRRPGSLLLVGSSHRYPDRRPRPASTRRRLVTADRGDKADCSNPPAPGTLHRPGCMCCRCRTVRCCIRRCRKPCRSSRSFPNRSWDRCTRRRKESGRAGTMRRPAIRRQHSLDSRLPGRQGPTSRPPLANRRDRRVADHSEYRQQRSGRPDLSGLLFRQVRRSVPSSARSTDRRRGQ